MTEHKLRRRYGIVAIVALLAWSGITRADDVPDEIDEFVSRIKLETMKIDIDTLTDEQARYLSSWQEGT